MDLKKLQELQHLVSDEIRKVESGTGEKSVYQLKTILSELCAMESGPNLVLSYPHLIIDSWDYADTLGKELMVLAGEYEKERARCSRDK